MKEIGDSREIRRKVMDCIETAMFKDQTPQEKERLLHMVGTLISIIVSGDVG